MSSIDLTSTGIAAGRSLLNKKWLKIVSSWQEVFQKIPNKDELKLQNYTTSSIYELYSAKQHNKGLQQHINFHILRIIDVPKEHFQNVIPCYVRHVGFCLWL